MKNFYTCLLIFFVVGCSSKEKNENILDFESYPKVELQEVSAISTFNDGDFFARPNIVTPLPNNHLLIADTQLMNLIHFDKNGNYLSSYGREGKGPGEFLRLNNIFLKGDTINVVDGRNLRISSFSLESNQINLLHENEFRYMIMKDYPVALFREFIPSENGNLTAVYYDFDNLSQDEMKLTKMITIPYSDSPEQQSDSTIQVFNLIPQLHKNRVILPIPYKTSRYFSSLNNGFAYALNDEPKIEIYNTDGIIKSRITLPDTRIEISKEEKEAAYDHEYRNSPNPTKFKSVVMQQMPDQKPVIRDLKSDADNRIWVQIYANDENNADWFVYEEDGTPVANLGIPEDLRFLNASGNRLFAQRNAEEGPEIVILEMD